MSNIGKITNVGKIIYENEHCVICVDEKPDKLFVSCLRKCDKGHIHYPLGFVLGGNGLDFEYKEPQKCTNT